eukprot:scaffold7482_cov151-Isochrysis_galbana.AAC.4
MYGIHRQRPGAHHTGMHGGARSRRTIDCAAFGGRLAAIRHAFGRRESEQGMPAARPRSLPRARTPHSGHIRDRCRGRLRLATPLYPEI